MRSRFLRAVVVCAALAALFVRADAVRAVSGSVVISEFRFRGPNGAADEFIELYNASPSAVDISGWKILGSNNAGTTSTRATIPANTSIGGGCFYLIGNSSASGGPYSGSAPANLTFTVGITDDGGIALVNAANASIDQVGLSAGSAYKEGAPLGSLGSTNANKSYERRPGGAAGNGTDTDNNAADFVAISPSQPQNLSSPCITSGDSAPSVSATTPANSAANVPVTSNVTITFSEPVTAAAGAFSLECPAGSARTFSTSVSGNAFTLTPAAPLPAGTSCKVTVTASRISDIDTTDPPDNMTADFIFTFATAAPTDAAPAVAGITPSNGTANVPVDSTIGVTFTESVTASASAFSLLCAGVPQSLGVSPSPSPTFTLTPASPLPYGASCTVTVAGAQISDLDANDPPDQMAGDVAVSFTTPPPAAGKVVINEVDADTPGSDTAEFIELYDGGSGFTALDGLVVVLFDGGQTGSGKQSYAAFDLDGFTTDANGYFVLGNPGVAGASIVFDPGQFGLLQNGPDAVALYVGNASDFPAGTNAATSNLIDAIVYGTDDASASGLLPLLHSGQPIVNENATGDSQTQSSQRCANGAGGARNTSTYYPGTPTPGAANVCPPPRPPSAVVISQIYGGGGNNGATYRNDFVELYNRSAAAADLTGWSLQYAAATGNGWDFTRQPLGGTIGAGQYFLISLASGGSNGAPLPIDANIVGGINMAAGSGKVALVNSFDGLVGNCPIFDPHIVDLVGYGSADCSEGATPTVAGGSAAAVFRKLGGSVDTDVNGDDFDAPAATPNPRRTAPIVELGPLVLSTDPRRNGVNAPRDATIQVTFTEPVEVDSAWFTLTCASSGPHGSATFAVSNGGRDHYITPNDNFTAGEQCIVMILKNQVHDVDLADSDPNTDTLPDDYSWSFTVATGTAPAYPPDVHLTMGNPSGAGADPSNYLMEKPEYALSYSRDLGRPNWVSWHLSDEWIGTLARVDTFRPDPQVPPDWYRVQAFDFSGSGFDRGHMTPNADRDKETSIPINQATFLMSNMVAQAPGNNQGPWAAFEAYLRTLVEVDHDELYIVSGPAGVGGSGSIRDQNNQPFVTTTLAGGNVTVPAWTWKAALVLQKDGGDDLSRVSCTTRTIAVIMPNVDTIRSDPWQNYLTTVDAVEALSGYDLFSNLPAPIQQCIEAGTNGNNPPLVKGEQTIAFAPIANGVFGDPDVRPIATSSSKLPVAFSIVSGPATIAGGVIHATGAGSVTVRASQPGSDIWNPAPDVDRTFEVAPAAPVFNALSSPSIEAGTALTTIGGIITAGGLVPPGTVTITVGAATVSAAIDANGQFGASVPTGTLTPASAPYSIVFSFAGAGNFASAGATSTLAVADTTPPQITLAGPATLTIEAGTTFVDPGATATDTFVQNLTPAIQVAGSVNTAILGSYTLIYSVSDGYNSASISRTVNVVDTLPPVIGPIVATPGTLIFPTNRLWPVVLDYTVTDASPASTCSVDVASNDLDDAENRQRGRGDRDIDWIVVGPHLVLLRAEAAPKKGPQLLYTLTVVCGDASGNRSSAQVVVPVRRR